MPKQVVLVRFELVVARFGPREIPKSLESGLLERKMAQQWVNNVFLQKRSQTFRGAQTSDVSPF